MNGAVESFLREAGIADGVGQDLGRIQDADVEGYLLAARLRRYSDIPRIGERIVA